MSIKGFQGTSLLDFPGKIASLIFFGGCNLTCPYCHNPGLVLAPEQYPDIDPEELLAELAERRRFIDGVVISGGEPTLAPELPGLLERIKGMGLQVKLDTNGLAPVLLEGLLRHGLVDYVALDLKTRPDRYGELHQGPVRNAALAETVALLRAGTAEFEIRTTCVPGLVEMADIEVIGEMISGTQLWVLQQYVPGHALQPQLRELAPHSPGLMRQLADRAAGYVRQVELRGL